MRLVPMHEAKAKLSAYVAASQKDRVLITSHGKPVAVVIGVEGEDLEDLLTRADPEFWDMIDRVRAQPEVPLAEARGHFAAADAFEAGHGRPMTAAEARRQLARGTTATSAAAMSRPRLARKGQQAAGGRTPSR